MKKDIGLSRGKLILIFLGSLLFIGAAIYLWDLSSHMAIGSSRIKLLALACAGFFGMCGGYAAIKLFDFRPGMILDSEGILDNSSAIAVGMIKWKDMREIRKVKIGSQSLLFIFVNNPDAYLSRAGRFRRFWMDLNLKWYGTPLAISTNGLKCNLRELVEWINGVGPITVREDS